MAACGSFRSSPAETAGVNEVLHLEELFEEVKMFKK